MAADLGENTRELEYQPSLGWPAWVISFFLFFYFAVHLWFASQGKEFWMDETDGIWGTVRLSLWELFREGAPDGQGSRSPLMYILDRIWLMAWNDLPHRYWDFRLFFRILPVSAWCATHVYLFLHLWRFLWTERRLSYVLAGFFAFAIAQFSYSNNFGGFYAIEARSYSLWVSFCFLYFLAFWEILRRGGNDRRGWGLHFVACMGLIFTTYASLVLIFLGAALLLLDEIRRQRKLVLFSPFQKRLVPVLALSLVIGTYYYMKLGRMTYEPASLELFLSSVLEVLLKCFHHHSYHAALVTFPLFYFVVPFYWWKRGRWDIVICSVYAFLLVMMTGVLYYASTRNGGLYASRYVIYVLPALTFLYLVGVITLVIWITRWIERRSGRNLLFPVLILLAAADALARPFSIYRGTRADIERFHQRRSFEFRDHPSCSLPIPHPPWDFEQVNNDCRGFTAPLPKNFNIKE